MPPKMARIVITPIPRSRRRDCDSLRARNSRSRSLRSSRRERRSRRASFRRAPRSSVPSSRPERSHSAIWNPSRWRQSRNARSSLIQPRSRSHCADQGLVGDLDRGRVVGRGGGGAVVRVRLGGRGAWVAGGDEQAARHERLDGRAGRLVEVAKADALAGVCSPPRRRP